jgi:glutaminyl-peptide cyclotransferase
VIAVLRAVAVLLAAVALGVATAQAGPRQPERLAVEVVRAFPHDREAYTQGLVLEGGRLYESTGLYGRSDLREVALRSGAVLRRRALPRQQFGEGLALVEGRLVQLTWQEGRAHVLDAKTFGLRRTYRYEGEGWGLCYDGDRLIQSDGSARLIFRHPATFARVGGVTVRVAAGTALPAGPVRWLNELECVGGSVYANVYQSELIVEIDAATGRVVAVVDASSLRPRLRDERAEVLNGIAYDPRRKTFLLTGKLWPRLFEVRFVSVS